MTDIPVTNTFQQRNWMVDKIKCQTYSAKVPAADLDTHIANIILMEWGYHPFTSTKVRKRELVVARQLFMTMLKNYSGRSLSDIGDSVRKNHATVISGLKTITNLYDTDKKFREVYEKIDERVKKLVR